MTELEPLPDELRALVDAERAAPMLDAGTRGAIRARLAATIRSAALGHAAVAFGGAGKILSIVALTVAAGAGTAVLVKHDPARRAEAAVVQVARVAPAPAMPAPPPPPVVAPTPTKPPPVTAHVPPAPTPSQPELLRAAWTALSQDRAERALELARDDEHAHPTGALAEERDALQIVALARLDRVAAARAAAMAFATRYPGSVHHDLVERAIHGKGVP